VQIIAFAKLDLGYPERLRRRQKNEEKLLYRYVLKNMEIMEAYVQGK
jgi:hypothetical protein